jgi:hypothetical protein
MTDRKARILDLFATLLVVPLHFLFGNRGDIEERWDRRQDAKRPRRRERRRWE